jgi:peptidoglycan hydrolase CwlO-like protein
MKYLISVFIILVSLLILHTTIAFAITAQECLDKNPSEMSSGDQDWCSTVGIPQLLAPIQSANEKNKQDLGALQSQLTSLANRINSFLDQLQKTAVDINLREEKMAYTKELFNQKARDQYTFLRLYDPISPFIFSDTASQAFQEISLRQKAADADRKSLDQYAQDLIKLKNDEDSLQKSKDALTSAQKQVSDKANFLAGEVAKANAYLATLSAKQQAFLAAKLASLNIPLYALSGGGCSSDLTNGKNPGFGGGFGFFTFGVPNRVGLNQYGAKGRAEANQNYDTILHAYYNFDNYQNIDPNSITIKVNDSNGYASGNIIWTGNLDQYIRRIYEVPNDWPSESLKAQVVAATSYVLAETDNGSKSICANTHCQVFQTGEKGGGWGQALTDIENENGGKIKTMIKGGQTIIAWFSSTHGGYVHSSGGDVGGAPWTKDAVDTPSGSVSGFSDLQSNAYDKDSPWFYCDWGGRKDYGNTAWLKPEELADIVNVVKLASVDSSVGCFVFQTDKAPPPPNPKEGCSQTDNWSSDRIKQELRNRGVTPFNSVSSMSVDTDWGSGKVSTVRVSGDASDAAFPGNFFKDYFNQRAPSNIQIVGPLFNVEKR